MVDFLDHVLFMLGVRPFDNPNVSTLQNMIDTIEYQFATGLVPSDKFDLLKPHQISKLDDLYQTWQRKTQSSRRSLPLNCFIKSI